MQQVVILYNTLNSQKLSHHLWHCIVYKGNDIIGSTKYNFLIQEIVIIIFPLMQACNIQEFPETYKTFLD